MHIILTHEQADFDAVASLMGAYLLCDSAIPVLPRRLNRNVRAFLALYGVELPFVDPRDLPNEPINDVTLVDTQSMVSVKGMGPKTRVQVIDHHPSRDGLPDDWDVTSVEIGATTTLIVEAMRERDGVLSPIQSTLLLLGIYEDTGSLTYSRTSGRDLRAAAYLLDHGANLQIASNFLNHPLSHEQQLLYDHLRSSAKHINIHGHTIVVACGEAGKLEEELSSIAHKLRDLLDPDALFLLITTRGGVQLIARSTSDNIDVAAVSARFGGGGHMRAAAGLIRNRELREVCKSLESILPEYVQPAITVSQIMSLDPQLLSPKTPVDEAARRMQRYGYEGYPVVEAGKVVGLLTRRAVDRALAHKLNLTAASLMEAGGYFVHPGDSVERLQRLVTETGWGQIPVVEPGSGDIVGIVTRTDLLKTLTPQRALPGRINLSERLEITMPPVPLKLLKLIAEQASKQRAALYIVGGFVRDLLLELPSVDFDLVVEGDAIDLARSLAQMHGGRVTSHARFGTAKWHLDNQTAGLGSDLEKTGLNSIDLVSARTEFYTYPTAMPTVERGSIKLDLHRRDFTINTLALRLDGNHYGNLFDYWGGLNDLNDGLVRVLHSLSFVDDPTRILRAVRFEKRFSFRIGDRTLDLMLEARTLIERLSGDRIRHELNHILDLPQANRIIRRLNELSLLTDIHPELTWDEWLEERIRELEGLSPGEEWDLSDTDDGPDLKRNLAYVIWLIRLSSDQARSAAKRLKLSADLVRAVQSACQLWQECSKLSKATPSGAVSILDEAHPLARYALYLAAPDNKVKESIYHYINDWKKVAPEIDGHYLKELGIQPGPVYRTILGKLRSAWLDGLITSAEEEKILLEKILHQLSAS